jgi:dethiobiotin synthetase
VHCLFPRSLFITGTDTGVGKTYTTARLLRDWRAEGIDVVGMKPLCCGAREDALILHDASGGAEELNDINPVWLRTPAAPYAAAMIEDRGIDLDLIRERYAFLRKRHEYVLVEGVGGWRVPILRDFALNDLAFEFGLPVAVVAANRLGALNHTLLTVESIRAAGIECAGIILNHITSGEDPATATNGAILEELAGVPLICEMPCANEPVQPSRSVASEK